MGNSSTPHIILFPFMSKGHTIPLLHLAKHLHGHRPQATMTVFTTPGNEPFVSHTLATLPHHILTIITLPFPTNPDIPPGIESTDQLPSLSLLHAFMHSTEPLKAPFETALESLRNRHENCPFVLISDGFLYWTQESAAKYDVPRLVFYGMGGYVHTVCGAVSKNGTLFGPESDDEPFEVPDFPWIRITRNDFDSPFNVREPKGPHFEFVINCAIATSKSYGLLINSFYELEAKFLDYFNSHFGPKCWPIGPLCLAEKLKCERLEKPSWLEWLDKKAQEGKVVLYVAFGSQVEISNAQLKEIVVGLENSGVSFLWAFRIKPNQEEVIMGFEERVRERGLIVKGWVEQREVLNHECVKGFLSHCGWNSVTESISASVPILAWPMMAEQHLNTRMVVEEINVGLRIRTCDGSVRGFVKGEELSKMVKELMEGEKGKVVKIRVEELSLAANMAMQEGGSSWHNLELLLNELEVTRLIDHNDGVTSYENDSIPSFTPTNTVEHVQMS